MSVDLHASQIQGFFDGPVDHLFSIPVLADYVAANYPLDNMAVVSPDAGRVKLADHWSDRLGLPLAIIHKRRDPNKANEVAVGEVVGDVKGRVCLLVERHDQPGRHHLPGERSAARARCRQVIAAATHPICPVRPRSGSTRPPSKR